MNGKPQSSRMPDCELPAQSQGEDSMKSYPDPEEAFAQYLETFIERAQVQGWDRSRLADRLFSILDHATVGRPPKGPVVR